MKTKTIARLLGLAIIAAILGGCVVVPVPIYGPYHHHRGYR